MNNLSYHGKDVSIVWDKDGSHYGVPAGYSLYVGGKLAFTSDKFAHLVYDPTTGTVEDVDKSGAKITGATGSELPAANQIAFTADQRVTDLFAKSGANVDSASKNLTDVAKGADTTTTYEAKGSPAANAVDGNNAMESFWGSKGSTNKTDTLTVTFKQPQTIGDIRLYFLPKFVQPDHLRLRRARELQAGVHRERHGTDWKPLTSQVRTPAYAGANYNRIQFDAVNAKAVRAIFTPQAGQAVGVKELEAYDTGIKATGTAGNQAPQVDAYLASSTTVTFNKEGDYVLKLTASDGELTGEKEVTVHGIPSDGTSNIAPQSIASASYTNGYQPKDNAKKVVDGKVVYTNTPNETWNNWGDNTGAEPTLQLAWAGRVPLKKAKVFFWTDGGGVPVHSVTVHPRHSRSPGVRLLIAGRTPGERVFPENLLGEPWTANPYSESVAYTVCRFPAASVDSRSMSSPGSLSNTAHASPRGRSCITSSICCLSRATACSPASPNRCRTVVNGGFHTFASVWSSNPATLTSCGT